MATPPMIHVPDRTAVEPRRPDPVVAVVVTLFSVAAAGLTLCAVLAVYDWRTPAAVRPLMWSLLGVFFGGVAVLLLGALVRWIRRGAPR